MIVCHNKTAIWTVDREVSYTELLSRISDFSEAFSIGRGDRVVILSENRPAYIYALFAIWKNGGIAVPIDCTSSAADLAYVLKDCTPTVILASEACEAVAREAVERAGGSQQVLVMTPDMENRATSAPQAKIDFDMQDTCLIVYTSGTTGSPKGVMLSFQNIYFNIDSVSKGVPIFTPDVRTMILLPCHHVLPLVGSVVAPLVTGGSVAFCPSMSAPDLMKTMAEGQVGIVIGVPRLYTMLVKGICSKIDAHWATRMLYRLCKSVGSRALSRLVFSSIRKKMGGVVKYFVCGGAALDPAVAQKMKTLGLDVLEGYGMTECAPMIAFTRPDDITPGASGQPVPGCEVEVRDGELVARGNNIMQGYYGRPEETAAVVKDGWIYTGDLGYVDDKGRVVVTGRRKEIIVLSNGKNVNPTEIEQKLEAYQDIVKEAAVTENNDALVAIIVPTPALAAMTDAQIGEKVKWEILDKYNSDAAAYKKIFNVKIYRNDLPRTRLDKIQRFKLKSLLVSDGSADTQPEVIDEAMSDEYKIIKKYIESEKVCKVRPTDHIELDLAFDSLDKVGLQVFLNTSFGLDMTTDKLSEFKSVADIADFVAETKTKMHVEKIDWKKILREHTTLKLPQTWITGRIFIALSQPFFKLYFKLRGKGAERIPDGPVIIAPNHQSFLDGLFVMSFLKYRDIKNTYFYAKEQHIRRPFIKFMAATHNVIVMDMSNLKESIQKMGEALKKKKNIIIFPEGTRTTDGKLGEFKKTFAILSKELNVPVVPVSIKGAFQAMPKGTMLPRPHKVQVEFLPPVYPKQSAESYENITKEVYDSIKENQEAES